MSDLSADVADLAKAFPLSAQWSKVEIMTEELNSGDQTIKLIGLWASKLLDASIVATGSAADEKEFPLRRAYFELLERAIILETLEDPERKFPLIDDSAEGRCVGMIR